ncbi:MAG: winged helix DNA-binding protein [Oscillospiraceae bacterium]|nr:winged helix DNA-binding protein [Oscillospiraceae bacterium]
MDYAELAAELMENMQELHRSRSRGRVDEAMRGEVFVLHYIAGQGGDVLPGEISGEMNVSSARTASMLNNLESKGLLTRQIDTSDRRKVLVRLTPKGKELAQQHRRTALEDVANMLEMLGEHDAREYVRIIGRLAGMPQNNSQEK